VTLNPEDPVVKAAVFGRQVEDFINSEIGRFITKRADDEIADCLEQLKTTDPTFPWGRRKIARIQAQIGVAERVMGWLVEAITNGHQAMNILEDKND